MTMDALTGLSIDGTAKEKPPYHIVSLSGGKDSTAMLILMVEKGLPIDMVLTADTGMEFPEMEGHLKKLDQYLFRERGIHITTLRHPKGFEWLMFDDPKHKRETLEARKHQKIPLVGNGWPNIKVRWCTGQLKTHLIAKEVSRLKNYSTPIQYIGIAADEPKRLKTEKYPLAEWQISEKEALRICKSRGFDWDGIYDIYRRCSCWCCPLQRISELRKLRSYHPALWTRLLEMDRRAISQFGGTPLGQFKENWTVEQLDYRFSMEKSQLSLFQPQKL